MNKRTNGQKVGPFGTERSDLIKRKNFLFFAVFLPMAMDGVLTLIGQDASYWRNFTTANEMSPAYFVMAKHPALFVLGGALWFAVVYVLLQRLKHPLNLMIAITMIAGHTWGSTSWVKKILIDSQIFDISHRISLISMWLVMIFYFVLIGVWSGYWISQESSPDGIKQ